MSASSPTSPPTVPSPAPTPSSITWSPTAPASSDQKTTLTGTFKTGNKIYTVTVSYSTEAIRSKYTLSDSININEKVKEYIEQQGDELAKLAGYTLSASLDDLDKGLDKARIKKMDTGEEKSFAEFVGDNGIKDTAQKVMGIFGKFRILQASLVSAAVSTAQPATSLSSAVSPAVTLEVKATSPPPAASPPVEVPLPAAIPHPAVDLRKTLREAELDVLKPLLKENHPAQKDQEFWKKIQELQLENKKLESMNQQGATNDEILTQTTVRDAKETDILNLMQSKSWSEDQIEEIGKNIIVPMRS